jgi:hypothetical protein
VSFAFLEGCRGFMNSWYQNLKKRYHFDKENVVEQTEAVYAAFNARGYLECYAPSTLIYFAEVPCSAYFQSRLSYTQEMCETPVDFKSCLNFYDNLKNPKRKDVLECGLGTICYAEYSTDYVKAVRCPADFAFFEISVNHSMVNGTYSSPTIAEFKQHVIDKHPMVYSAKGSFDSLWNVSPFTIRKDP